LEQEWPVLSTASQVPVQTYMHLVDFCLGCLSCAGYGSKFRSSNQEEPSFADPLCHLQILQPKRQSGEQDGMSCGIGEAGSKGSRGTNGKGLLQGSPCAFAKGTCFVS
jgi:hypothetical protein